MSCSKDKSLIPEASIDLYNNLGTTIGDTMSGDSVEISMDSCYGVLSFSRGFKRLANHSLQLQQNIGGFGATFSDTLFAINQESNYTSFVDSVACNGIDLVSYSPYSYFYQTNSFTPPVLWRVKGNSIIPNFTYTNTNQFPFVTSSASLPDTITISNGFSHLVTGLLNCSKVRVTINNGNFPAVPLTKIFPVDNNNCMVDFSVAELAVIANSNNSFVSTLNITLIKDNVQIFEGKQFNFQVSTSIGYTIIIN